MIEFSSQAGSVFLSHESGHFGINDWWCWLLDRINNNWWLGFWNRQDCNRSFNASFFARIQEILHGICTRESYTRNLSLACFVTVVTLIFTLLEIVIISFFTCKSHCGDIIITFLCANLSRRLSINILLIEMLELILERRLIGVLDIIIQAHVFEFVLLEEHTFIDSFLPMSMTDEVIPLWSIDHSSETGRLTSLDLTLIYPVCI